MEIYINWFCYILLKGSRYLETISISSSMRKSWLYFATRSLLHGAPVLICPAFIATARSAIKGSSVSPLLWLITALYALCCAISTASTASLTVPIWFTLTRIAFATRFLIPASRRFVLVTNRSSPTSWTLSPMRLVSSAQPSQSSSARPSSIDMIG